MSSSGSSGDKSLSQDSQASSQDSVRRVMHRFISGSQEEAGPSSGGGHYLPSGPGGLGGDSQVFQTANHFELEEGGGQREQVEYTISHRVDVAPVRLQYSQAPYSQPQSFPRPQYEGPFYNFGSTPSAQGIGGLVPVLLIGSNRMPISLSEPSSYGFRITFEAEQQPVPKSAAQTYVPSLEKLIIKKDARCTIPFSFDRPPPEESQIRVVAVYKVPVMLSESVQCCAAHSISESKEVGSEKAPHFVKSLDRDATYLSPCRLTDRFTVVVPLSSMHRIDPPLDSATPTKYIGVFRFPCYTSHLPKPAKTVGVQLLFGLEIPVQGGHMPVARVAVDARVCASPGRDRDLLMAAMQESNPSTSSSPSGGGDTSPQSQGGGRKRAPSPLISQNIAVSCSSTKRSRLGAEEEEGQEGPYTITTSYKDIHDILLKIKTSLELTRQFTDQQIRTATEAGLVLPGFSPPPSQPVSGGDDMPSTSQPVLSWLQSIGMEHCHGAFEQLGVREMFQLQSITAEELRGRGVAPGNITRLLESRPTSSSASAPTPLLPSPTSIPDTQPTPDTQPAPDSQVSLVTEGTEAQVTHRIEFRMRRTITRVLEDLMNGPDAPMDEE